MLQKNRGEKQQNRDCSQRAFAGLKLAILDLFWRILTLSRGPTPSYIDPLSQQICTDLREVGNPWKMGGNPPMGGPKQCLQNQEVLNRGVIGSGGEQWVGCKIYKLLIGGHRFVVDTFPDSSDPRTLIINDGTLSDQEKDELTQLTNVNQSSNQLQIPAISS